MIGVNRHDDVVQQREGELRAEQLLHQREVEADAHPVLVPLAVVGGRRIQSALVEIDIKVETSLGRRQLGREVGLVLAVDRAVERTEVLLYLVVKRVELLFQHVAISLVGPLRSVHGDLRGVVLSHHFTAVAEAGLRHRQECLGIQCCGLVWLGFNSLRQGLQVFREHLRNGEPTGRKSRLLFPNSIDGRKDSPERIEVSLPCRQQLAESRVLLASRELLDGRDEPGHADGLLHEGSAARQQRLLELARFFGFCEFGLQVITKLLIAFPRAVTQRACRPVDEFKPALDEGAALERGEQRGVLVQLGQTRGDNGRFRLAEFGKSFGYIGESLEVAKGGLLVEVERLRGDGQGQTGIEFRIGGQFAYCREPEQGASRVDRGEQVFSLKRCDLKMQHQGATRRFYLCGRGPEGALKLVLRRV